MKRTNAGCYFGGKTPDGQSGQASVFLLVILGTFLLASAGFAVDLSNMWFNRQTAQSAADSSCVAGAMDMLYLQNGTITTSPGFTAGSAGDCSSASSAAICQYAGFNGYTATTSAGTWGTSTAVGAVAVNWTFPASVTGVTAATTTYPFLNVVVRQKAPTWFMGLLGVKSMTVGANCTCGLTPGAAPAPIVVLNPTIASALSMTGGVHIVITGGPPVSIEVDSSSATAVNCTGGSSTGYTIDTTGAGPSANGGQLAVVGGPTANPQCGSYTVLDDPNNKFWKSSSTAVPNPYQSVPAPTQPGAPQFLATSPIGDATGCIQNAVSASGNGCGRKDATYGLITGIWVGPGTDTCPSTITSNSEATLHYLGQDPKTYALYYGNCLEFSPGYYPTGINLQTLAQDANDVAIFQPGIYYLNGDLNVSGAITVRNTWIGTQPSTNGVVFYFLTGGPLFAGGTGAANTWISSVPSYYLNCSSTTTPAGMPTSLSGNVLAGQCSAGGTYVGAPSSDSYSATGLRGLMLFTAQSDTYINTLFDAASSLNYSGALYFDNVANTDAVTWNGAGTASTYAIGNIVVDQLIINAAGTIHMGLTGASPPGAPVVSILQ